MYSIRITNVCVVLRMTLRHHKVLTGLMNSQSQNQITSIQLFIYRNSSLTRTFRSLSTLKNRVFHNDNPQLIGPTKSLPI